MALRRPSDLCLWLRLLDLCCGVVEEALPHVAERSSALQAASSVCVDCRAGLRKQREGLS